MPWNKFKANLSNTTLP